MSEYVFLDEDCNATGRNAETIAGVLSGARCCRCGRKVKPNALPVSMHPDNVDHSMEGKLDSQGQFKIGRDCAKQIGLI